MSKKNVEFESKKGTVKFEATKSAKKDAKTDQHVRAKVDKIIEESSPAQPLIDQHTTQEEKAQLDKPRQPEMDEQFPADYNAYDKRDKVMEMKLATQEAPKTHPGVTPFGVLKATDDDFKWLAKKRAQAERAQLHAWFARTFDHASPEKKALARRMYPEVSLSVCIHSPY